MTAGNQKCHISYQAEEQILAVAISLHLVITAWHLPWTVPKHVMSHVELLQLCHLDVRHQNRCQSACFLGTKNICSANSWRPSRRFSSPNQ
jgi:hypothetical protein